MMQIEPSTYSCHRGHKKPLRQKEWLSTQAIARLLRSVDSQFGTPALPPLTH